MENILYKPFQRLDFVHKLSRNAIFVRARLNVPLHQNEEIDPKPSSAHTTAYTSIRQYEVKGPATGSIVLYPFNYLIEFMPYDGANDDSARRDAVESRLNDNVFTATTIIHKNPSETVTNTIDKEGDIEVED